MIASLASIALLSLATLKAEPEVTRRGGTHQIEFQTDAGAVRVYLPDDIRPGDRITGTVIAEPEGKSERQIQANSAILEGLVVEVGTGSRKGSGKVGAQIPALVAVGILTCTLKDSGGRRIGTSEAPIFTNVGGSGGPPIPSTDPAAVLTPIAQTGSLYSSIGRFDGDLGNTSLTVGGTNCPVLAESPRKVTAFVPNTAPIGSQPSTLSDGSTKTTGTVNCIKVELSAPRTTIRRGEAMTVTAKISGLGGIPAEEFPIPFEWRNLTPSVISFPGSMHIRTEMIGQSSASGGSIDLGLTIQGIGAGSFGLSGTVFCDFKHDQKMEMPARMLSAWVRRIRLDYEAELKEKNGKDQFKQRCELLNKVINFLKNVSFSNNDPNATKSATLRSVDHALNTMDMFDTAKTLLSAAADMLGYSDLPMPSVITALKGIKALNAVKDVAKLDKAIELAEKAEKIQDAAAKAKAAKEVLETLRQVQAGGIK